MTRLLPYALTILVLSLGAISTVEPAEAQTCDFMCDVCYGGGHSYGAAGEPRLGNDTHPCGNLSVCGEGENVHEECGVTEGGDPLQKLMDAQDLKHHDLLGGERIFEIVARSDGRFYVNLERRAVQQLDCDDQTLVVAHLPLSSGQIDEYRTALADADRDG